MELVGCRIRSSNLNPHDNDNLLLVPINCCWLRTVTKLRLNRKKTLMKQRNAQQFKGTKHSLKSKNQQT
jgi:hypothetical protein